MNLRIFETPADLISAAARAILQRLEPGVPTTIAISGGSTPKPLYEWLASQQLDQFPITWVVVDERYVPPADPQYNAGMIERTLFANGLPAGHRFLRFRTELQDPAKTAEAFEDEWRAMNLTRLDLILLGCGDDGHTASLFPGTTALHAEGIAAAVYVPRLEQWRVTLTLPVIREAGLRLVLAAGESKAPILRDVRAGVEHPVALATRELDSWWLVDRAAASKLL
ncbi:MAG TPA: 6-phosphogluconolactonase [Thermoanaerobaculia bacterium]|jgi:6-phosphogluconolactonase